MILALALGGSGCERDEAIFVVQIYPSELLPQGLATDDTVVALQTALKQEGFILAEGSKRNYAAKVEVRRESQSFGSGKDTWQMRVVLAPRDAGVEAGAIAMEGLGETAADEAVPSAQQLAEAAAAAAKELAEERKMMRKPKDEIVTALSSPSRRVRDFAVRLAGARKIKDLVPVLSKRLADEPESDLVLRIVGALVQIGDDRAVSPLVELTKRKHPIFINQIVFAVAQIGGQEAEAYLDTLAQGHPSDQVRAAARDALQELLSRKSAKLKR
ncbi:MAG: HEAT repeat domain-containing protein [Deltaproteobacteria bacterium]|nr:HEAT repeat domain-containing protein [Deltaproteobacteria bacterium]